MLHSKDIIVRRASSTDEQQLARLAALDSSHPISGSALVAEADARIVAALPLGSGRAIADPFEPTAEVVALLELRAAQMRNGHESSRGVRARIRHLIRAPLPG